jgi:hypothetical protein
MKIGPRIPGERQNPASVCPNFIGEPAPFTKMQAFRDVNYLYPGCLTWDFQHVKKGARRVDGTGAGANKKLRTNS